MEFLTNTKKYCYALDKLLDVSDTINICSYGIFAGVTNEKIYNNIIGSFLTKLEKKSIDHTIIISYYIPSRCPDCNSDTQRKLYFSRLKRHIETWDLNFYLVENTHLKAVLAPPDRLIIGGINPLSSSDWKDMSVYLRNKKIYKEMQDQFDIVKYSAHKVHSGNIDECLEGVLKK